MEDTTMDITEILGQVKRELANSDPWKVTPIEAKQQILELFKANNIPETEYKPYMANNVLPELLLK